MNKRGYTIIAALCIILFNLHTTSIFAKDKKSQEKYITKNLLEFHIPATIEVPIGTKIEKGEWCFLVIKNGQEFNISLHNYSINLKDIKKDIKSNDIDKLKSIYLDKSNILIYSTETFGIEEFHFYIIVKINGKTYSAENTKGFSFTKKDVDNMINAINSIKLIKK